MMMMMMTTREGEERGSQTGSPTGSQTVSVGRIEDTRRKRKSEGEGEERQGTRDMVSDERKRVLDPSSCVLIPMKQNFTLAILCFKTISRSAFKSLQSFAIFQCC
jgi:hypothetical protein